MKTYYIVSVLQIILMIIAIILLKGWIVLQVTLGILILLVIIAVVVPNKEKGY